MTCTRYKIDSKLTLLKIFQKQSNNPFRMLEKSRFTLLQHLLSLFQPPLRFIFSIFIKFQHHKCRVHCFMIIIKILIFTCTCQCLKKFHTEMVNIINIFRCIDIFPIFSRITESILENLFCIINETFACHSFILPYNTNINYHQIQIKKRNNTNNQ